MPVDSSAPQSRVRFEQLQMDDLDEKQRVLAQEIGKTAKKAGLGGPFNLLLRSPDMLAVLNNFSNHMRFNSSLTKKHTELVCLIQARYWTAQFLWWVHVPIAIEAGLNPLIIEDLKHGRYPNSLQPDEHAIYEATVELSRFHLLKDQTFWSLRKYLSEKQMADFVAANGFLVMTAMALNVSEASIPGGGTPPLSLLDHVLPLK